MFTVYPLYSKINLLSDNRKKILIYEGFRDITLYIIFTICFYNSQYFISSQSPKIKLTFKIFTDWYLC